MIEVILTALVVSSGIALAAAGITIIYMSTETFNFAHASFTAMGFFVVYHMLLLFGGSPYYYFPFAALFTGLVGVLVYLTVNKWLIKRGADMVTLMMSTLGVDLILFGLINHWADFIKSTIPESQPRNFLLRNMDPIFNLGFIEIPARIPISLILVVAIILSLHFFLTHTKFGIAMRTTIENPTLARVMGVNTDMVYLTAWFIGAALAGLGGAILSMIDTGSPIVGIRYIVPLFAGAIVGGLYSVFGSLLGGFLIGLSQQIGIYLVALSIGSQFIAYKPAIPLIIMVLALLFFPEGLGSLQAKLRGRLFTKPKVVGGGGK